jgi:hypothetical protein
MYDKLRKFDEAEKLYLRIIELEPGNMNNYYVVAEFYKRYASDNPAVARKAESMYLRRLEVDAEGEKNLDKFQELRKRSAERKKLEEELKKAK